MNVSVIIPTYNRAHLVTDAIRSVLAQSYQDLEIIVVDDGSTDGTETSVREFGEKILFIKQKHQGPNAARNRALRLAKGKYIALLDDDDWWLDFKLELQVALMDLFPDVAYIFSDFYISKESGEVVRSGLSTWSVSHQAPDDIYERKIKTSDLDVSEQLKERDIEIYTGNLYYALLHQPFVLPSSALIRRECIASDIRFAEEDFHCGDWDFFARLSRKYKCAYVNLETTVNRSHSDAVRLTRKSAKTQTACRIDLIQRVWKADKVFYQANKNTVDAAEAEQLLTMAKYQVLDSEVREAGETLKKSASLGVKYGCFKRLILNVLIRVPGAVHLLMMILNTKKRVASLRAGSA